MSFVLYWKYWLAIQNKCTVAGRDAKLEKPERIFQKSRASPLSPCQCLIWCLAAAVNIPHRKFHYFIYGWKMSQGHTVKTGHNRCRRREIKSQKITGDFSWDTQSGYQFIIQFMNLLESVLCNLVYVRRQLLLQAGLWNPYVLPLSVYLPIAALVWLFIVYMSISQLRIASHASGVFY